MELVVRSSRVSARIRYVSKVEYRIAVQRSPSKGELDTLPHASGDLARS